MTELVIATRNKKKLKELKRYLRSAGAEIHSLTDLGRTPRVREDKNTFRENAVKKACLISRYTGGLVLADDSGLEVRALKGRPGVKSARFAGPGKNDIDNNRKVLRLLRRVPSGRRGARFVCAIAIADKGKVVKVIEEDCKGKIAFSMRGGHGFGYDPLFLIPKYNKTFGELGARVKDRMSHRAKALKKARAFLKKYI